MCSFRFIRKHERENDLTWQIVDERRRSCSLWPRVSVRVWQTTVYGATGGANGEVLPRCFSEYSETSTRGQEVTEGYRQTANTTTTTKRFEFGWVVSIVCLSQWEMFPLWGTLVACAFEHLKFSSYRLIFLRNFLRRRLRNILLSLRDYWERRTKFL